MEKQIGDILDAIYLHGRSGGQAEPIIPGAMTIAEGVMKLLALIEKGDLSLTPTDALLEELLGRYETGVIGLARPDSKDSTLMTYKTRWKGNSFLAVGLAHGIAHEANEYRLDNNEGEGKDLEDT